MSEKSKEKKKKSWKTIPGRNGLNDKLIRKLLAKESLAFLHFWFSRLEVDVFFSGIWIRCLK